MDEALPASLSHEERHRRLMALWEKNSFRTVPVWRPAALLAAALFDKAGTPPRRHQRPHQATEAELFAALGVAMAGRFLAAPTPSLDVLLDACECVYTVAGPKRIPILGREDPDWFVKLKAEISEIDARHRRPKGRPPTAKVVYDVLCKKYPW